MILEIRVGRLDSYGSSGIYTFHGELSPSLRFNIQITKENQ